MNTDEDANNTVPEGVIQNEDLLTNPKACSDYLKYGFDTYPNFISPDLLKKYLSLLLGDNPYTKSRHDFFAGTQSIIESHKTGHLCDFCGNEIQGGITRLDDGRERCDDCSGDAVETIENLEEVLIEAKSYFKSLFKQSLPKGITVEFTPTDEIQAFLGRDFIPTSGMDARAIGVASGMKIMIENGAPYGSTLATIVHELTHIWQFNNLNTQLMRAEKDLLLVEGHAVWAELKVLEHKNIGERIRQSYDMRDDEYGNGLKLINKILKNRNLDNAFKMLKDMYPR